MSLIFNNYVCIYRRTSHLNSSLDLFLERSDQSNIRQNILKNFQDADIIFSAVPGLETARDAHSIFPMFNNLKTAWDAQNIFSSFQRSWNCMGRTEHILQCSTVLKLHGTHRAYYPVFNGLETAWDAQSIFSSVQRSWNCMGRKQHLHRGSTVWQCS